MPTLPAAVPTPTPRPSLKQRLEALLRDYGGVAAATYFSLFGLTLAGFTAAIGMGIEVEGASSGAGTLFAAWVATKLTQPVRILATIALTPLVARLRRRPVPPDAP